MCVLVASSCLTLCDPQTVARQTPLSVEFSRQENWSGFPFPSPGDLPGPGIGPWPPALQVTSIVGMKSKCVCIHSPTFLEHIKGRK